MTEEYIPTYMVDSIDVIAFSVRERILVGVENVRTTKDLVSLAKDSVSTPTEIQVNSYRERN